MAREEEDEAKACLRRKAKSGDTDDFRASLNRE